jgi:hypothetical protein
MLRTAVRSILAACLAATMLPMGVAAASPRPTPALDSILAAPPSTDYAELRSTPGILQGPFDASGYASIGGMSNPAKTLKTLADDGFISGFGRAWVQQTNQRVLVEIVVAFTGDRGALSWLKQSEQADLSDPTYQHAIALDGIARYYGARMSDTASYFADAFVFVKGNDGFLVSTISANDDLGDSAAMQARAQYAHAPAYTIPPSGWPGVRQASMSVPALIAMAPRMATGLAVAFASFWIVVAIWMVTRRRRPKPTV